MTQPRVRKAAQQDLGFGPVVAGETQRRFLNKDGTFNVRRIGLPLAQSRSIYRDLLTVSWPLFLTRVAWWYLGTNLIFAVAYMACGPGALEGPEDYGAGLAGHFLKAFFFSIQTVATIGYGRISPMGIAANMIVALESVSGLVLFALIAGIVFARFSRPRPSIRFSDKALIAPYGEVPALMFRIANTRDGELFDVSADVSLARKVHATSEERLFESLQLERSSVTFFPLSWTLVHPIDASSPMYGLSEQDLRETDTELLIRLTAYDDTSSQTVHIRSSYKSDDIVWGAKFVRIIDRSNADGIIRVDINRISEYVPAELPAGGQSPIKLVPNS